MESLIHSACVPVTSLSLVSISIKPEDRYRNKNENLSHLDDIYKNTIFSHSFTATQSPRGTDTTETRQNSRCSMDSYNSTASTTFSRSRSNSNLVSLSPSLKCAYFSKRASSFRKQRSFCNSVEDTGFDSNELSYFSHRSSITSMGSMDCNDAHPLMISECVIDDDEEKTDVVEARRNGFLGTGCALDTSENAKSSTIDQSLLRLRNNKDSLLSFLTKLHDTIQRSSDSFHELKNAQLNLKSAEEVPLETYSQNYETLLVPRTGIDINLNLTDSENFLPLKLCGKTRRIREHRVNPHYLLQYALDTRARERGLLTSLPDTEIDIFDDILLEKYSELSESIDYPLNDQIFDDSFHWKLQYRLQALDAYKNIDDEYIYHLKLASIARFKLCATVTLPPRLDDVPSINSLVENIYPTASLDTCHVPWLNFEDLKSGKAVTKFTRSAGLLKGSNIQYVSKRCSSKRWVCVK